MQLKENSILEWMAPFFVMGLVLVMVNAGAESPDEWLKELESQVTIYFNLAILGSSSIFMSFFIRKNGVCKLMLPGTMLEKWLSLWAVVLLNLLYWFILGFLADGIMLLIGTQSYGLTVSRILEEYRQLYLDPNLAIFYLLSAAGVSFIVPAANTIWGQGKLFLFLLIALAVFFAFYFLLPETILPTFLVMASVALLIAGYFIFKQTIMNTKEVI